jgi:hypothetical protein
LISFLISFAAFAIFADIYFQFLSSISCFRHRVSHISGFRFLFAATPSLLFRIAAAYFRLSPLIVSGRHFTPPLTPAGRAAV